jgi:hypothetical protein
MIDTKVAREALVAVLVYEDRVKVLRRECAKLATAMIVLGALAVIVLLVSALI